MGEKGKSYDELTAPEVASIRMLCNARLPRVIQNTETPRGHTRYIEYPEIYLASVNWRSDPWTIHIADFVLTDMTSLLDSESKSGS